MATVTTGGHVAVVKVGGRPGARGMAQLTVITARHMRHMFAGRGHAVMATVTTGGDITVVEHRTLPGDAAMTVIAVIAGFDMTDVLTIRDDPVMTTLATASDGEVIDPGYAVPLPLTMAVVTILAGGDMRW